MNPPEALTLPLPPRRWLLSLALIVAALVGLLLAHGDAPRLDRTFGSTTAHVAADRAYALFPGDCVEIEWHMEGIQSLYIDGAGQVGSGADLTCPGLTDHGPRIEVRAENGLYRQLRLRVHYLPALLLYAAAFALCLGSLGLAAYLIAAARRSDSLPLGWIAIVLLLLTVAGAYLRLNAGAERAVEQDDGAVALRLWAEQERLVFPRECARIGWSVVGAGELRINGKAVDARQNPGWGEHCGWQGESVTLAAIGDDGAARRLELPLPSLFGALSHLPVFICLNLLGLLLAALIFLPLAHEKLRALGPADIIAPLALSGLVALLYLPGGISHIAQLESWYELTYADSHRITSYPEYYGRFFVPGARTLARLIDPAGFAGHHIAHGLILAGNATLFYALLRRFQARALYAFLAAALFIAYPVNDWLLSTRSMPVNASVFWFLLAACALLDYRDNPRRLSLVGALLALLMNVATHESGFGLILVFPCLLWFRGDQARPRKLRLRLCFWLAPVFKGAYLLLLLLTDRPFYESENLAGGFLGANILESGVAAALNVYQQTFAGGWLEAFAAFGEPERRLPTLMSAALIGCAALYLARFPAPGIISWRKAGRGLALGALLVLPAIGVLMWMPYYNSENWRIFFYAPLGAAIAMTSAILLLTAKIQRPRLRDAIVISLCLALLAPCLARLYAQRSRLDASADAKARILLQIVELAPAPKAGTDIALMIPLDFTALKERGIEALLLGRMFDSALSALYQADAPRSAIACVTLVDCSFADEDETFFRSASPEGFLPSTLFFELREDETVALIPDPIARFGLDMDVDYDASPLYDASAPVPARAHSMLRAGQGA